jgi:hypothetical protein
MPAAPGTSVSLQVPGSVAPGQSFTAHATVSVPADGARATRVTPQLQAPRGWQVGEPQPSSVAAIEPGSSATFAWQVRAPNGRLAPATALTVVARYVQHGTAHSNTDERIVGAVPAPPPAGTDEVSDLQFLSSTNGWGPVERDMSNGEQAAGDGHPITIDGTQYAKGLGTNAVSHVQIYLGGQCTHFSAQVGVDDEVGSSGTVTFSVAGDGTVLASTGTLHGGDPATAVDADVTGVQVLDLGVGDAGDGNGHDHADWAEAVLTCS